MPHTSSTFDLAGIRFIFEGLAPGDFNTHFHRFLVEAPVASADLFCTVTCGGANPDLRQLRSDIAWNFQELGGDVCLTGANPGGEVMWRMTGHAPFEQLHFEWHPTAFDAMYRDKVYGPYNIVAILALVLRLLPLGGLVLHGSAQVIDGAGILCTGPSGQGKSTISRLFHQCGRTVLTDEHPILRRDGEGFRVYGSPWPSSGGFVAAESVPLKKIYFIEHGPAQEILPLTRREAVLRLLDVAMVPWMNPAFFDPLIPTLEAVIREVPFALLRFRPDTSVVDTICRDLAGESE
ncbi:MAG: hypothetical protein PHG74_03160 [Kiritimatiellae bacterium]|jgi:hypothetical protein|nr:hypothetical protein [Kiritimatiellia bacterium]